MGLVLGIELGEVGIMWSRLFISVLAGGLVDLHGESLANGDGLLLEGRPLYAVQNRLNAVAVVELDRHATEGRVVGRLTDPRFDIPTTVARFGSKLYLPNARFSTPPTPDTRYDVIAIRG